MLNVSKLPKMNFEDYKQKSGIKDKNSALHFPTSHPIM